MFQGLTLPEIENPVEYLSFLKKVLEWWNVRGQLLLCKKEFLSYEESDELFNGLIPINSLIEQEPRHKNGWYHLYHKVIARSISDCEHHLRSRSNESEMRSASAHITNDDLLRFPGGKWTTPASWWWRNQSLERQWYSRLLTRINPPLLREDTANRSHNFVLQILNPYVAMDCKLARKILDGEDNIAIGNWWSYWKEEMKAIASHRFYDDKIAESEWTERAMHYLHTANGC